jgi:hypothetical protein
MLCVAAAKIRDLKKLIMIPANELRINNWYSLTNPMNQDDKDLQQFNNWTEALDFEGYGEPIPLTIAILKLCGFVDYAKNGCGCRLYLNNTDELFFGIQDNALRYQTRGSGFTRDFNIKSLHQLQTFYYLLTGKELEVSL